MGRVTRGIGCFFAIFHNDGTQEPSPGDAHRPPEGQKRTHSIERVLSQEKVDRSGHRSLGRFDCQVISLGGAGESGAASGWLTADLACPARSRTEVKWWMSWSVREAKVPSSSDRTRAKSPCTLWNPIVLGGA